MSQFWQLRASRGEEPTPPKGGWVSERPRSETPLREIGCSKQSDLCVSIVSGLDDLSQVVGRLLVTAGPSSPGGTGLFTVFRAFERRLCDGSYRFATGPLWASVSRTPQGGLD